ncbi:MAG TPA: sugar phosphate nucleotidyltransferase [Bdellovibrio sp.]|nr:sugar phosphate nucleotidyltransferase [Bdellovibrio sp.]
MNVMVLAAGEGTRLRPFTHILPKPAMPFLNIPLAAHSLGFLNEQPINKLVVNTFHLPTKIHELFHRLPHGAKELIFSDEVGELLGSGGGLGKARDHFKDGGDFVMMNADEIILPQDSEIFKKALEEHRRANALCTILVMDHPEVGSLFGGVWADAKNQVRGFGKSPIAGSTKGWHFIGVQIFSERIFQYVPTGVSNILYDAVTAAIGQGEKVQAFPFAGSWFETGNPIHFFEATKACLDFLNGSSSSEKFVLEKAFKKYSKSSMTTQGLLHISTSAFIDKRAQLKGFVCAAEGSSVGAGCVLENVIIGESVQVPAGTKAENTFLL